ERRRALGESSALSPRVRSKGARAISEPGCCELFGEGHSGGRSSSQELRDPGAGLRHPARASQCASGVDGAGAPTNSSHRCADARRGPRGSTSHGTRIDVRDPQCCTSVEERRSPCPGWSRHASCRGPWRSGSASRHSELSRHYTPGRGNFLEAKRLFEDVIARIPAEQTNELFGQARSPASTARTSLAIANGHLGQFTEALAHASQALRDAEPAPHAYAISSALYSLGVIRLLKGRQC